MKRYGLSFLLLFPTVAFAAGPTAKELLVQADRARGAIDGGVKWDVTLSNIEDGAKSFRRFKVKGLQDDALVETQEPVRNKGEILLFNDRTIWYFKPSLKKPVAVSARQKLMGQMANGDIASTNYSRDYTGTIVGQQTINGEDTWKLDLKAKDKSVTYDGIHYWISKKSRLAVRAEYLTLDGKPFKNAVFQYNNKVKVGNKILPFISEMQICDQNVKKNCSTMEYLSPETEKLSSSIFNINNLMR